MCAVVYNHGANPVHTMCILLWWDDADDDDCDDDHDDNDHSDYDDHDDDADDHLSGRIQSGGQPCANNYAIAKKMIMMMMVGTLVVCIQLENLSST